MDQEKRDLKDYLYTDGTEDYRIPMECHAGETVEFRIRAPKGVRAEIALLLGTHELPMSPVRSEGCFSWYSCKAEVWVKTSYIFRISFPKNGILCYYGCLGVAETADQCSPFTLSPGFFTPEWARGAVIYQIYVDRFCNGDPSNDVLTDEYAYINGFHAEHVEDWYSLPATLDVHRFYGGDLAGVRKKLDYLQELGVEVIYFNPIFVSPSNHKYDSQDYQHIDPHLTVIARDGGELLEKGEAENRKATRYINRVTNLVNLEASNAWFADFMKEVHSRGMRVILDGVFNHCGSFNRWMDREYLYQPEDGYAPGAWRSPDSPYRDYFYFQGEGADQSYEGWWNFDTLPKLNYDSESLVQEILGIGKLWLKEPYQVDGWRLDVAADLGHSPETNHAFWKRFRQAVREENPEALILAEHYGDPIPWLQGDEWDSIMNYDGFMEPVTYFLTGMEKHSDRYDPDLINDSDAFFAAMHWNLGRLQTGSALTAMNELSNHDHSRFLTRTNRKVGRLGGMGSEAASEGVRKSVLREAVVIQMTWPGAPTLYYGDEAGLCGFTDPDNRRTYPWGREDHELIDFHQYLIRLHKKSEALRKGSYMPLGREYGLIAYGRFTDREKVVVAVNNIGPRTVEIPVWRLGVRDGDELESLMITQENGYNVGTLRVKAENGKVSFRMGEHSAVVYRTVHDT